MLLPDRRAAGSTGMRRAVAATRRFALLCRAEHDSLGLMTGRAIWAAVLAGALVAGCVAPTREAAPAPVPRPIVQPPPVMNQGGLDAVVGHNARALVALFGTPDLDDREGPARKLQFLGPACVLDAYLYPPHEGAEPVVTYVDARSPDGRDFDRASCIAALSRREEAR